MLRFVYRQGKQDKMVFCKNLEDRMCSEQLEVQSNIKNEVSCIIYLKYFEEITRLHLAKYDYLSLHGTFSTHQ